MTTPTVNQADLERVHREMCITVPLDQISPLLLATLTAVAHCQLVKRGRLAQAPLAPSAGHQVWPSSPLEANAVPINEPINTDFKRRAAADFD